MTEDSEQRAPGSGEAGRRASAFPDTPASAVLGLQSDDPLVRGRALRLIVEAYWRPVYKVIRLGFRRDDEDAKDMTQAFFTHALERDVFASYDPGRARFRTFLRACLRNFVTNRAEAEQALKRGGSSIRLSLDFEAAERELRIDPGAANEPFEAAFDRHLVHGLHAVAVARLRRRLLDQGRELRFRLLELYDLAPESDPRPTYAELAKRFGVKPTDVTNHLYAARRDLRRIVLHTLREITASEEEFRDEARELLGVDPSEATR